MITGRRDGVQPGAKIGILHPTYLLLLQMADTSQLVTQEDVVRAIVAILRRDSNAILPPRREWVVVTYEGRETVLARAWLKANSYTVHPSLCYHGLCAHHRAVAPLIVAARTSLMSLRGISELGLIPTIPPSGYSYVMKEGEKWCFRARMTLTRVGLDGNRS